MTQLSQLILDKYQVRKTRKQKNDFITLMTEHYPSLQVQEAGLLKSRNLVIGDVDNAAIILGAHYDTCARMIIPNFITPKNPLITILYSFLLIIPMGFIIFLFNALLGLVTDDFMIHYWVSVALWLALMYVMVAGPANPNTANDNTSGVIVLCEVLAAMSPSQRDKTVVVFFDNEELGLVGSSCFRKRYKKILSGKLMVNFDCVSDGDYLLVASSKQARKLYSNQILDAFSQTDNKKSLFANSEKVYYPSDQAGFQQHIAVAALKHKKCLGYYMDRIHTKKDTMFDKVNIQTLCDCTKKLIDLL